MRYWWVGLLALLCACGEPANEVMDDKRPDKVEAVPASEFDDPIVTGGWKSVMIQTNNVDDISRLWTEIGQYEAVSQSSYEQTLKAPGSDDGFITFISSEAIDDKMIRPATSRSWDTGCYWSIMMRAKGLESIIEDAKKIGWEPLTEMAYLEFGPSKLHIVVLTHMKTGTRVQLYERLTTPLPEGFPEFERISRPFNIMQMVKDRDASYKFFTEDLGFETFYYGQPFVSPEPVIMPLGIPKELTTSIPYKAAIVFPEKGMEWGRFEMIEIEGMPDANDYSENCHLDNEEFSYGTIGVLYEVDDLEAIKQRLENRDIKYKAFTNTVLINSPDGSLITFSAKQDIP